MMVVGLGYCFMGVWTFARMLLLCTMNFAYVRQLVIESATEEMINNPVAYEFLLILSIVFIMLFAVIDGIIRLFIGFSARANATGKKRNAYIVWLIIVIILDFMAIILSLSQLLTESTTELMDFTGSFLMNIMVLVISVDLLVSCLYVRKYRKLEGNGLLKEALPDKTDGEE